MAPTVLPYHDFNDEEDAKALKQAFKGFGTDEDAVIEIITKRSNEQRRQISARFKTMYGKEKDKAEVLQKGKDLEILTDGDETDIIGLDLCEKDLIKELKSELRGNFEDAIIALMTEPVEFQAKQLHKAISGLGTDENTIVEILGVHNNEEVVKIAQEYEGLYQRSLESDIKGDTSGTLKRLLVGLSTGCRDESNVVDEDNAFKDAQDLLQAGELLFAGTEESVFNAVFCQRNIPQLRRVFEKYEEIVGHSIEKAIENEFSGTAKDAMLQLIECVRDKVSYLATRLHDSMAGIGTDDRTLIRVVVSRSEIDLEEIKDAYESKYGKTLAERIADDTSGDYKKALIAVVG